MTAEQNEIITALRTASMLPGIWDKKFIEKMYFSKRDFKLSASQNEWLYRLLYKYRVQLPDMYEKYKDNEFCKQKPKP